ncbi:MAG: NUDIX hydrolase [Eubacteriales bacterium]|nr:NUDIX hydrolase [Eubacteriales bacterium]
MAVIDSIKKLTDHRFLNMYQVLGHNDKGHQSNYMVASRAKSIEELQISTGENQAHGVIIYALAGEKHDKVVLIRQYRYPINTFVYEMPAGLVEPGEDYREGAVREMKEETGLTFTPLDVDPMFEQPRYTTVGMTDESCAIVYGYAEGEISDKYQEGSEEIQTILADKEEIIRIMKEERVALNCAYQLMHFLHDEDPFAFLGVKEQ